MCAHCVGEETETQMGRVTKGSREADWQSWGLDYALPLLSPAASAVPAGAPALCRDARVGQLTPWFYC